MVMERRRIPCSGSSCSEPCGGKSTVVVERDPVKKALRENGVSFSLSSLFKYSLLFSSVFL
jgi:hypothetical protein